MTLLRRNNLINTLPFVILVVSQLHLLRNISSMYSILILFSFFLSVWFTVKKWSLVSHNERIVLYLLVLIFFTPIVSMLFGVILGIYSGLDSVGIGIARLMFSLPIYLVIIASSSTKENLYKLLFVISIISLVAALSIPYQFIFGPISWFAENSERSGFFRYASMFGSLTALGLVCGYAILASIISIRSTYFKVLVIAGIVVGSILSLQKAALINIVFAVAFLPFVKKLILKDIVLPVILLFCLIGVFGIYFGDELSGYLASVRIFSDSESAYSDDVSVSEGLIERLIFNPSTAISYHGLENLFLGLGPIGGSGSFGYPDVPMSHNGFVDIFLIGGLPYFLIFCLFFYVIMKISFSNKSSSHFAHIRSFGFFVFFWQIINMIFSGLILFAPSNAMFLAIAIKCIISKENNQNSS